MPRVVNKSDIEKSKEYEINAESVYDLLVEKGLEIVDEIEDPGIKGFSSTYQAAFNFEIPELKGKKWRGGGKINKKNPDTPWNEAVYAFIELDGFGHYKLVSMPYIYLDGHFSLSSSKLNFGDFAKSKDYWPDENIFKGDTLQDLALDLDESLNETAEIWKEFVKKESLEKRSFGKKLGDLMFDL